MKVFVSISMSILFFFQGIAANMEICEQIEEISHFLSHYQDHKEYDGYSFVKYIYEDYIDNDGNPEEHHQDSEHDNAPVHTSHQCCQHFVFIAGFQPSLIHPVVDDKQTQFNYYAFQLNSRYLESLFQPPRV
jgi:hypothetical protein|tara:strand:- start:11166 stop:11561 length:396 start_codon:yes stop_codon:yes gene_type:complete